MDLHDISRGGRYARGMRPNYGFRRFPDERFSRGSFRSTPMPYNKPWNAPMHSHMGMSPFGNGPMLSGHNGPPLSPPPRPRMNITKGEWIPLTKLGRLVKDMKIKCLEEVFLYDLPILEPEIFDHFLGITIKEEVLAVVPTDKALPTGERYVRFKALAVAGDSNGHVGLGVQISKEVSVAIAGASLASKLNIIPIRRGFWGRPQSNATDRPHTMPHSTDRPHTLPCKVNASFGSVTVRLVPAPRGSGSGSAPPVVQQILMLAGIDDAYFISHGPMTDLGFLCKATLKALSETFAYFQEEVCNVAHETRDMGLPEMMGHFNVDGLPFSHLDFNDNNNPLFPFLAQAAQGGENGQKAAGVDRRQSDSRFQRDLAMNGAGIMAPPFDAAYPLHIMQGLPFHPTKYVPRNKRAPQLAPIPTRKRSSIPIVAPPPDDEVLKGPDEALVNMGVVDNQVLKTKGPIKQETGTNAVPELCLSLRPRPSSISSSDDEEMKMRDSPFGNLTPALPFKGPNGTLNSSQSLGKISDSGKSFQKSCNYAESDLKGENKPKGKNNPIKGNGSNGKLRERPSLETVVEAVQDEFEDDFESDCQ